MAFLRVYSERTLVDTMLLNAQTAQVMQLTIELQSEPIKQRIRLSELSTTISDVDAPMKTTIEDVFIPRGIAFKIEL